MRAVGSAVPWHTDRKLRTSSATMASSGPMRAHSATSTAVRGPCPVWCRLLVVCRSTAPMSTGRLSSGNHALRSHSARAAPHESHNDDGQRNGRLVGSSCCCCCCCWCCWGIGGSCCWCRAGELAGSVGGWMGRAVAQAIRASMVALARSHWIRSAQGCKPTAQAPSPPSKLLSMWAENSEASTVWYASGIGRHPLSIRARNGSLPG